MKVVIMAGGKGTRISSVASDIPKPMIKIEGIPVLEREIECLKEQGFDDIIITVSHLGNIIMDYFGDGSGNSPVTGQPFGVHIEYYFENEPLGNAGALFKIKDKLTEDKEEILEGVDEAVSTLERMISEERVEELLSTLTDLQRKVVHIHLFHGLSFTEAAKHLGMTRQNLTGIYNAAIYKIQKKHFRALCSC